jgi:hypothetical protein
MLIPVYWAGEVYEIRRGLWFELKGANYVPCDENFTKQIEDGYKKYMPWRQSADKLTPAKPLSSVSSDAGSNTKLDAPSTSVIETYIRNGRCLGRT